MNPYLKREPLTKGGRRLRAWRLAKNMTQTAAADVMGLEQSSWARLELGERYPGRAVVKVLHEKTGIPVTVLLGL